MNDTDTKALALTGWGASTLDALQGATETNRAEIARRACEEAIADARTMAEVQGSLFEKLLVIHRFELYRSYPTPDGGPCESIQQFIEEAVAPVVTLERKTLFKLRDAVWEAGRLRERYGTVSGEWGHLSMLAAETRRQEKGEGALSTEEYEKVSRLVAAGSLSQRDLGAALKRPPRISLVTSSARRIDSTAPLPGTRCSESPFDRLARIAADAKSGAEATKAPPSVARTIEQGEELGKSLDQLALLPFDTWMFPEHEVHRLHQVLGDVRDAASATLEVVKLARVA